MRDLEALDLRELQEVRSNLVAMLDHPGFKWIQVFAKNQIETRWVEIANPLSDLLGVLKQEFLKGEIAGIQTFIALPSTTLEFINQLIASEESTNEPSSPSE